MSHRFRLLSALLCSAALVLVFASGDALGQQPQPKPIMGLKGKVNEVANDLIAMTDQASKQVLVKVTGNSKVKVEGDATADFLQPGIYVEFAADMTKLGAVKEPLEEITVCDLTDTIKPTFGPDDPTKPTPKEKDAIARYAVRGQIKSNRNGKLMIAAPGAAVRAELSPNAKIKVSVPNIAWAQPEDDITVNGMEVQPGQIVASEVTVKMRETLEGAKKKTPIRKKPLGK